MHDDAAFRTTGANLRIADTPLKELRRLDAGLWKGEVWAGAVIPTLNEVLAAMPPATRFFIEIKSGPEIIAPLERVLKTSGLTPKHIRLLSFNATLIEELKQRLPDWHSCWLCDYRHTLSGNIWRPSRAEVLDKLLRSGADGLASANRAFLDQDLVEKLRKHGKEIHVWTVDRLPDARRLCKLGVDSIMTNRPGWLRRRLAESPAP
jgi:glycerophosphoryl diester phosphodiesterase